MTLFVSLGHYLGIILDICYIICDICDIICDIITWLWAFGTLLMGHYLWHCDFICDIVTFWYLLMVHQSLILCTVFNLTIEESVAYKKCWQPNIHWKHWSEFTLCYRQQSSVTLWSYTCWRPGHCTKRRNTCRWWAMMLTR